MTEGVPEWNVVELSGVAVKAESETVRELKTRKKTSKITTAESSNEISMAYCNSAWEKIDFFEENCSHFNKQSL